MNDQTVYLNDILERIHRIEQFTEGGQEAFSQSLLIQDAVIRSFEVIGEAVKHLSLDLKQAYPQIPWRQIAGFRDVLIHDYGDVDVEEIWEVIEQNLPALKRVVETLLENGEGHSP
ncbi:MAG: DUF86 domain-containing protein [Chloroflexota bacterium]